MNDNLHNRIASRLSDAFRGHFRYAPPEAEVRSWRESLKSLSQVFQYGSLLDHGVMLEYQLPLTSKRLDCMITGHDEAQKANAVIVELKQWQKCESTDGDELVRTWLAGANRDTLHPSAQAAQYQYYLADAHTAFYEGTSPVDLSACAYLHNYSAVPDDTLYDVKFDALRVQAPLFTGDEVDALKDYLVGRLKAGNGLPILQRIEQSKYRPSKKLLDHVSGVIKGEPTFVLLDEQRIVYQKVLARVRAGISDRRKQVFIVHGGPGTGKSVIAINLLSDLAMQGFNAQYATGSRAFTKTLHKVVGRRASAQFKYFHNYGDASPSEVDVLINDEAHRIRATSNNRYTPKSKKKTKEQIEELLDVAKVSVFFIDDKQSVRPNEVGSSDLIRQKAEERGCEVLEYSLQAQFRCAGSDAFISWIDNTLEIERTAHPIWDQREESFDFRIFSSPEQLETAIRMRAHEGGSARLTAGFCWPWSKVLKLDGTLIEDVVIGSYRRPWNARSEVSGLAPGIPREVLWAKDPNGIDQIGCIYTAQGFEFDYAGVIWGTDIAYDFDKNSWSGNKKSSHDSVVKRSGDRFLDLVKNTYRVLLSRGMKGCYVCFLDKDTERFVRSRTEGVRIDVLPETAVAVRQLPVSVVEKTQEQLLPFRRLNVREVQPFKNCVPLIELKLAAGRFSDEQEYDEGSVEWVELPPEFRPQQGLFVAQVVGESMNRRIPNGSWCLFRQIRGGTRQGKVVVAQHREISDVETGGHFTVKVYESAKAEMSDGTWKHTRITLNPDTTASGYEPIVLEEHEAENLQIIAELVAVLG